MTTTQIPLDPAAHIHGEHNAAGKLLVGGPVAVFYVQRADGKLRANDVMGRWVAAEHFPIANQYAHHEAAAREVAWLERMGNAEPGSLSIVLGDR